MGYTDPTRLVRTAAKSELLYGRRPSEGVNRVAMFRQVLVQRDLDALLFVAGVDSGDNAGCIKAINYLLCGASGTELTTPLLLNEALDDTMVLIYSGGVRVYTTPAAGKAVARVALTWPGIEILAMDAKAFRDQDAFEDHKILGFREMVKGFDKIGFALPPSVPTESRAMEVEKWPIIKSYGLDEGGQRKFFSMVHKVYDVYADLEPIYATPGAHDVGVLLVVQGDMLKQHWNTEVAGLDQASQTTGLKDDMEPDSLLSYFRYGSLRREAILKAWGVPPPTLVMSGEKVKRKGPPLHCIFEAHDPQAPLYISRCCFFTSLCAPSAEALGEGAGGQGYDLSYQAHAKRLLGLYNVMAITVQEGVLDMLSKGELGEDPKANQAAVRAAFGDTAKRCRVPTDGLDLSDNLTFSLTYHHLGPYTADGALTSPPKDSCIISVRLTLSRIRSDKGEPLGGLQYGDTMAVASCVGSARVVLPLTKGVPGVGIFGGQPPERKATGAVSAACSRAEELWASKPEKKVLEGWSAKAPLGGYLCCHEHREGVFVYVPGPGLSRGCAVEGRTAIFVKGVVVQDHRLGAGNPCLLEQQQKVTVCIPNDMDHPVYAVFAHRDADSGVFPVLHHLQTGTGWCTVMCFQAGSSAKREFVTAVLPTWREAMAAKGMALEEVSDLPEEFTDHVHHPQYTIPLEDKRYLGPLEYRPFTAERGADETPDEAWEREADAAQAALEERSSRWVRFAETRRLQLARSTTLATYGSGVGQQAGILEPAVVGGGQSGYFDDEIAVHLVAGWPGCGKHKYLSQIERVVTSYGATQRRVKGTPTLVLVLQGSIDDGIDFDPRRFYQQMREAVKWHTETAGRRAVVYAVPGTTPLPIVYHHLAQITSELPKLRVSTATVLVSKDLFYRNHATSPPFDPMPGLTWQLVPGYISQVLLSSQSPSEQVQRKTVEQAIRHINPVCDIVFSTEAAIAGMGLIPNSDGDFTAPRADLGTLKDYRTVAISDPLLYLKPAYRVMFSHIVFDRLITTTTCVQGFLAKVAEGSPETRNILRIKGLVHCTGQHAQGMATKGKPYLTKYKVLGKDEVLRHRQEFFIIGHHLDDTELKSLLQHFLLSTESIVKNLADATVKSQVKAKKPLITRDSLQQQDIEDISISNQFRTLPEGWYFDGISYVSPSGEYFKLRPDLDQLIDQYIAEKNEEIKAHNKSIDAQLKAEEEVPGGAPATAKFFP